MLESATTSSDMAPINREAFQEVLMSGHASSVTDIVAKLMYFAEGPVDSLSGCFLDFDDDLAGLVARHDDVTAHEPYTLQLKT